MREAKRREQWEHTGSIMAMTWNSHRTCKEDPVRQPSDFGPFAKRSISRGIAIMPGNIDDLKLLLPGGKRQ